MAKNSVRKSRKQRKVSGPKPQPKPKLFCPRTMVRYDGSPNEYYTVWVCKMCLSCILTEDAVKNHLINCSALLKQKPSIPLPKPATEAEPDIGYICQFCDKVFSRQVTLKKHLEQHEKSSDPESSDNDD